MMEIKSLKEIASLIRTGKTPPTKEEKYFDGEINWYSPGDLDKTKYLFTAKRTITQQAIEDKKAITFPKDTLLVGCIGDIGKLGITSELSSSNQQLTGILPNDETNVSYLYYWFKGNKKVLENYSNNAVVPILNNRTLETVKIPLPPLDQQKKIAAILDAADAYRQKTKALIEKYDELTQSLFLDMFGDPVANPKGWEKKEFTNVFGITTGKLDSNQAVADGQYPFFTCAKQVSRIDVFSFDQEALMLAGNNAAGVYDIKYYNGKFDAYQRTYVLTLNEGINYQFFRFHLEQKLKELQKVSIGSGTKYLTMKILERIMLLCPDQENQNIFTSRVNAIEKQKAQAQASLAQAEDLFNSLLQRAFKGELS